MFWGSYLLASSSLNLTSISLLGGCFGNSDGSHAYGSVAKNCTQRDIIASKVIYLCMYYDIRQNKCKMLLTLLFRAEVVEPRSLGSIARRFSNKGREEGGKSLNVSTIQRLYGCCGLKRVAFGSRYFFQYSSDGEPHNLNILCSCST